MEKRKIVCLVGILLGIILFLLGIVSFMKGNNLSLSSCQFGADFYTDIYRAVYRVFDSISIINSVVCFLLIGLGSTDICYFVFKLLELEEVKTQKEKEEYNQDNQLLLTKQLLSVMEDIRDAQYRSKPAEEKIEVE